jgi:SRSO17 transposase
VQAEQTELGTAEERFEHYIELLTEVIGHADRAEPLQAYTTGLILPGERKSVEPMAARLDPRNVRKKHQSMHHFVADAPWSDEAVLEAARSYALPAMLGPWPDSRLDCRRHRPTKEGHALGRGGAPVLRPTRQDR